MGWDVNQIISKSSRQQTMEGGERDGSKVLLYIFLMEKSEFKDHEYKFCDKTK